MVVLGVSNCKEYAACLGGGLACGGGCFPPWFPHVSEFSMAPQGVTLSRALKAWPLFAVPWEGFQEEAPKSSSLVWNWCGWGGSFATGVSWGVVCRKYCWFDDSKCW